MKKLLIVAAAIMLFAKADLFARCAAHLGYHAATHHTHDEFKTPQDFMDHMVKVHGGTGSGYFMEHMIDCHDSTISDAQVYIESLGCEVL